MTTESPSKDKVLEILKTVHDPELKRDIVSLGMVKEIGAEGSCIFIHLEAASAAAVAVREIIQEEIKQRLRGLQGVKEVTVQISSPTRKGPAFAPKLAVEGVQHIIAVASGKGGVGKTTVAVNLALALAQSGKKVGLMDGDIYGPNVPLMLGVPQDARPEVTPEQKMVPISVQGIRMISMGLLVPADQPMIWRGPMLHSAVTQFLQKVHWGNLDVLLIDLPPGTGDVQLTLVQTVPLSGAIIVTTPQEVALMDVRKGIAMFRKTEVPILGIIENMTGEVFGRGGGRNAAAKLQVRFLGEIPLDARVREGGDAGRPIVTQAPETPAAHGFIKAANLMFEALSQVAA